MIDIALKKGEVRMRAGLLGFTLLNPNKGCEALTYSFLYTLQKIYGKNISVRYYSTNGAMGYVEKYFPDITFSYYQLSRKNVLLNLKKDFEENCDVIYDISWGDAFSDIYNPKSERFHTSIKLIAGYSKVPFILLPQTYGPFERKTLERQAAWAIKKATYLFSRDELSTAYIKEISNRTAKTVTDLAFTLPYTKESMDDNGKIKLGINVSGLLWKGGFYRANQFGLRVNYQEYVKMLIEHYLENPDYEIHLIPHVVELNESNKDGDVYANKILHDLYPSVIVAPEFRDPIETKNYIAKMDVLTAPRMHATVDAFSTYVPVIPFAYSRKFKGLYGALGYHYIVDGCKLDTVAAFEQTIEWIKQKDVLKKHLIQSMEQVNSLSQELIKTLKDIL